MAIGQSIGQHFGQLFTYFFVGFYFSTHFLFFRSNFPDFFRAFFFPDFFRRKFASVRSACVCPFVVRPSVVSRPSIAMGGKFSANYSDVALGWCLNNLNPSQRVLQRNTLSRTPPASSPFHDQQRQKPLHIARQ